MNVERKADAYAHQVSDTMEYIEKAWHEKEDLWLAFGLTTNRIANLGKEKQYQHENSALYLRALDSI